MARGTAKSHGSIGSSGGGMSSGGGGMSSGGCGNGDGTSMWLSTPGDELGSWWVWSFIGGTGDCDARTAPDFPADFAHSDPSSPTVTDCCGHQIS